MARLNIDVHMSVAHPTSRSAVRVHLDPNRDVLALDDEATGDVPEDGDDRGPDA